jgi:hypothetical protein
MTLNLSPEEKAERFNQYKKDYSKQYYRALKAENSEAYKDILNKAKERYQKKKAEKTDEDGANVRKYVKRDVMKKKE